MQKNIVEIVVWNGDLEDVSDRLAGHASCHENEKKQLILEPCIDGISINVSLGSTIAIEHRETGVCLVVHCKRLK